MEGRKGTDGQLSPASQGARSPRGRGTALGIAAAVFVGLALVAAFIGLLVYRAQARDLRERTGQELTAVRALQSKELADWHADQLKDAQLLANDPILGEALERWIGDGQPSPAPLVVRSLVSTYQEMHDYARVTVLDPDLRTVYSSPEGPAAVGAYSRGLARRAMREDRVVFSDFFVDDRGDVALEYVAPVRDLTHSPGVALGAYILRVDPADSIFPVLAAWPAQQVAGETHLVERRGREVVFINPSPFEGGAALTVRRPLATPRLAGALAVRGTEGVVDAVDHTGEPVLASAGPVPGTPWYLVARIAAAEVGARLRESALATFGIVVGVILAGGLLLIIFWSRRESRQMRLLYAAERDLRASEEHFRLVFDDAPLGISLTSPDGRLSRVNTALAAMLGYEKHELEDLTAGELTHPDDRAEAELLIASCLAGERDGFTLEKRTLRKDGAAVWTTVSVVLLRRPDGSPDHFVAMLEDVTERRADELRLARLGRLYRVLVAVNEAIVRARGGEDLYADVCRILVDVGGYAGAWIAVLGPDGGERALAAAGLAQVPLDDHGVERAAGAAAAGLSPVGVALRRGRADACGDVLHDPRTAAWHALYAELGVLSAAALPVRVPGGPATAVAVYSTEADAFGVAELELFEQLAADVAFAVESFLSEAARAAAERSLAQLNRELEQRVLERTAELRASNAELEAFSYSVSHDLRAPLRALDGFSHALLEDYDAQLDDTGRDYLRRVRTASQRMGSLIDDLLTLSRVTRRELAREPVDLADVARDVVAELREAEPGRRVEVTLPDSLPVEGDPALLRAVVQNLLGNAWKFTSGREVAHVELGVAEDDGETVCYVRDDGAGFDEAYAGKLFVPFQRLHTPEEFPGTGVGLATAERIVRRHGGRMWARGTVDSGATFYFTLR